MSVSRITFSGRAVAGEDWAEQKGGQTRIVENRMQVSRGGSFDMESVEWEPEVARGRAKVQVASS